MNRQETENDEYLLTTQWLRTFKGYLEYRIRCVDGSGSNELIRHCHCFIANPTKVGRLIKSFRSASAMAPRAKPKTAIALKHRECFDLKELDKEQNVRQELSHTITSAMRRLRQLENGPAIRLSKRIRKLARERRSLLRMLFDAYRHALSIKLKQRVNDAQNEDKLAVNTSRTTRCFERRTNTDVGIIAPTWLRDIFACDGLLPVEELPANPSTLVVCIGDEREDEMQTQLMNRMLEANGAQVICWHYGSTLTPKQIAVANSCQHVFASDTDVRAKLEKEYNVDAHYLPPAVQPKIHNPIGNWNHQDKSQCLDTEIDKRLPKEWRNLILAARGLVSSSTVGADKIRPWMDEEMSSSIARYASIQEVLSSSSIRRRVQELAKHVGPEFIQRKDPLFSAVVATKRPWNMDNVFDAFCRQTYTSRELVLVLHGDGFDLNRIERRYDELGISGTFIRIPESRTLGECLQVGSEVSNGDIIGKMDDDNLYGANYMSEMVMMLECSDAAVVGKKPAFRYFVKKNVLGISYGDELSYTSGWVSGATITFKKEVLSEVSWRPLKCYEDIAFCNDCFNRAIPVLATSRFNFVSMRRDASEHTYQASWNHLMKKLRTFPASADPRDVLL